MSNNILKKLTCATLAFLAIGCAGTSTSGGEESSENSTSSSTEPTSTTVAPSTTSAPSSISSSNIEPYKAILPEIRFTSDVASEISFATTATKSDLTRPEVSGKFTVTNCADQYQKTDVKGTMKVRGNQTAGWSKKGFRMKFGSKLNLLGLNKGNKYKKWILLADAKDTTLSRTALGLYVAKGVCKDEEQVWVSDFTPVSVYLNDQYWGFYYLCEQKEVKEGRVNLQEPAEGTTSVNIGYCFELDHYADSAGANDEASEIKKGKDGDPTFRVKYSPKMEQGRPSGPLATGQVNTYTMLSDITDGPRDSAGDPTEHLQADYTSLNNGQLTNNSKKTSNSPQLTFIRDRVEALYQVLYEAAINKKAKVITDDNQVVNAEAGKSSQQCVEQHFDVAAWVDGYIINAFTVAPDLGYSSFYMSYDNTANGDHKLRYDVPWDFDSNFGNRNNFYVNADGDTYVDNTYNTWLYLFSKMSWFVDLVKVKWNKIRDEQLFENMFHMLNTHFATNDGEIQRDHQKWPQNDAAHQPPNNFDEIREPYKDPAKYKEAEAETISWCAKRVNFLEKKWGKNRPNVNTNA